MEGSCKITTSKGLLSRVHPQKVEQQHDYATSVVKQYLNACTASMESRKHFMISQALEAHVKQGPCPAKNAEVELYVLFAEFALRYTPGKVYLRPYYERQQKQYKFEICYQPEPSAQLSMQTIGDSKTGKETSRAENKPQYLQETICEDILWLLVYSAVLRMKLTMPRFLSILPTLRYWRGVAAKKLQANEWWIPDEKLATLKASCFTSGKPTPNPRTGVRKPPRYAGRTSSLSGSNAQPGRWSLSRILKGKTVPPQGSAPNAPADTSDDAKRHMPKTSKTSSPVASQECLPAYE